MTFTLKKKTPAEKKDGQEQESKKRTFQEMQKEQKQAGLDTVNDPNGEKRQKGDDEPASN